MAVVAMKKLTLIGDKNDKEKILDALRRLRCFDAQKTSEIENTAFSDNQQPKEELQRKMQSILNLLHFVDLSREEKFREQKETYKTKSHQNTSSGKPQKPASVLSGKTSDVSFSVLDEAGRNEADLFDKIQASEKDFLRLSEIKSEISQQFLKIEQLQPYSMLPFELAALKDTSRTSCTIGTMPQLSEKLKAELIEKCQGAVLDFFPSPLFACVVCAVFLKEDREGILSFLNSSGFTPCQLDTPFKPSEAIQKYRHAVAVLEKEKADIFERTAAMAEYVPALKLLYDYFNVSFQKEDADSGLAKTQSMFILQGWVPLPDQDKVSNALEKLGLVFYADFSDPLEDEFVPTLLKNNWFARPFEFVTNMLSPPSYRERDPNFLTGIFFAFFFGIMIGDVGYGLIMLIGGLLFLKFAHPQGGLKNIAQIITICGVPTIFWGIMFGGYFSIQGLPYVLLSPLDDAMTFFMLSLVLGFVHIVAAMAMNLSALLAQKRYLDAWSDVISWYILFLSAIVYASSMFIFTGQTAETVGKFGMYAVIASLLLIAILSGAGKKGFGKFTGAFGGLYKIIGLFSDILSYLRLFGLGLVTGVIGMVFNMIATMLFPSGIFGYVLGGAVLLIGHVFNLVINLLGTYVHDSRLTYVEYYSRFYTGEGKLFSPLGSNTKFFTPVTDSVKK